MPHLTDVLDSQDLARISNLQLFARTVVEGFCTGLHASPHKGFSVEFKQHRPYTPGDEIRRIDWKVYGRSDRFYIREYEEETNLRCNILLDVSGSMAYEGTVGVQKFDYARRIAACLAYLMVSQQDAVGMVTFDTKVRAMIPARSRTSHLKVLLDTISDSEIGGETELGPVIRNLIPRLKRRGLVVVLSDCFGDVGALMKSLAHLRHKGHEVIVFQIWDRDELDFPFKQWTKFINLEALEDEHLVDPASVRRAYMENLERYEEEMTIGCRRNRIDIVKLVTDEPYAEALSKYLAYRLR